MSRAMVAAGALLASAALVSPSPASADAQITMSPDFKDAPIRAAAPAPAPAAEAAPAPAARGRAGRRRTRLARAQERRVARAAAELSRRVDPFAGIRHLTLRPVPAPLPPGHGDDVGQAVATLETPPPGNREAAAPTPGSSDAAFAGAREAASHTLAEMLARHAFEEGVPVALAKAVVRIESGGNARATNHGALGLMQIKWATARAVGFSGPAVGLLVADTNLRFGMKVLAQAYRDAHGDLCGALMRYQSGHLARHPSAANRAYCAKARSLMARG